MRRCASEPSGSAAGSSGASTGHQTATGESGSRSGRTTESGCLTTSPLSRISAVSPPQPEPVPTCALTTAWPRASPRIMPSTRAGCSCEAVRAESMASWAWSSSTTMTSVITMPMAGEPAFLRARRNSAAIPAELVSVSSIISGWSSWSSPDAAVAGQHRVRGLRPPLARLVLLDPGLPGCVLPGPVLEDRVEDLPGQLDLLLLGKKRRVAEQHVEDEAFVGFRTRLGEGSSVGEVHVDVADLHGRAGDLRAEPHRDALVGLDPEDHGVVGEVLGRGLAERQVRGALEDQGHLGDPATESLARAQVEGDTGPASGLHVEPDRCEGLGGRGLRDVLLVEVAVDLLAAGPARGVLATSGVQVEAPGEYDGGQDLLLLHAQALGVEGDRLLHRHQGHQLDQVVLDHVAGGTDAVVVARATADADVLGHGDLHVVDVVRVPDRLEEVVGEAHREDVLHRLLAQVVVDPEHRLGREDAVDDLVQLTRGQQVVAERLLHHDAAPGAVTRLGQLVHLQLVDDVAEVLRRDREVERVVATGSADLVELLDGVSEPLERGVVGEVPRNEAQALGELAPHLFAELGAGMRAHRVVHDLREVLVGPVTARVAHEAEARRQQAAVGEVVDRRHHLLACQVAGHAEQHHATGAGDPRHPPVVGVPQRVGPLSPLVSGSGHSVVLTRLVRPWPRTSWRTWKPAFWSVRCRRRTGRPWSARTAASPIAWAPMKVPNVKGRPGISRSSRGSAVTCR